MGCHRVENVNNGDDSDVHVHSLPNKTATSMLKSKIDSKNQLDLLHARLGHPSVSKMKYVSVEWCKGLIEYNCGVCYHSKHHKFPFIMNTNRALECFELTHMDLWGAYRVRSLDVASYFLNYLNLSST